MEPMKNYASIAIGVWVDAGSVNENPANNGVAHVVEHMLFKGTKSRSARDIADEMTAIGGNLDAYTSKECTCYYTRTLGEYADKALEIIADMLIHSKIDPNDLKKELGVILDEIDMYEDDADEQAHELLQKEVWGDHPLGYIISGEKETVRNFTCDDVRAFMEKYYTGEHMVISVAGSFEENQLLEAIQKYFGTIPYGCQTYGHVQTPGCVQTSGYVKTPGCGQSSAHGQTTGPDQMPASCQGDAAADRSRTPAIYRQSILCRHKDIEQMHLDLAFDCISYDHRDKYVMAVVNSILGGNLNSRLFQEVREEKGLAYTIYSYGSSFKNCGLFQIYAAMAPEQTHLVLDAVFEAIHRMATEPVTERELTLTKQQIRTELLMATESTHNRMEANAKAWIYQKTQETIQETIARVEALTAKDIACFLHQYMNIKKASLSLIGNFTPLDPHQVNQTLEKWNNPLRLS